jgi:hypothetical protein
MLVIRHFMTTVLATGALVLFSAVSAAAQTKSIEQVWAREQARARQ